MNERITNAISGYWGDRWDTPERVAQVGRLCGRFSDAIIVEAIDEMADDPGTRFFDARKLRIRCFEKAGQAEANAVQHLDSRGQFAHQIKREWQKQAMLLEPDKRPVYTAMHDDQVLALHEQAYRDQAMTVYGYVPPHWDWFRSEWTERHDPDGQYVKQETDIKATAARRKRDRDEEAKRYQGTKHDYSREVRAVEVARAARAK